MKLSYLRYFAKLQIWPKCYFTFLLRWHQEGEWWINRNWHAEYGAIQSYFISFCAGLICYPPNSFIASSPIGFMHYCRWRIQSHKIFDSSCRSTMWHSNRTPWLSSMLIFVTHFTLLLVAPFVCINKAPRVSASINTGTNFGFFQLRGNDSDKQSLEFQPQNSMVQRIGVLRGILLSAGIHLEPRIEAIGRCPDNADSKLANLCATDYYTFPEEIGTVGKLQEELLSKLKSGNSRDLGEHLNLVIQKVSPVWDSSSGLIYANSYCASCHNVKTTKLPRKLFCELMDGVMKCFVAAELPDNIKFSEAEMPTARFHFSWDSIFTLSEDIGENDEASTKYKVFEIFQWICCLFSLIALVLAICVFSTSPRLRRPLPGKMMIALCCALLGSVITFLLGSGIMDVISTPKRPLCVILAWLFLLFLLSSFVWMLMFSVELLRTFGLSQLFKQIFLCYQCRKFQSRKANATVCMPNVFDRKMDGFIVWHFSH